MDNPHFFIAVKLSDDAKAELNSTCEVLKKHFMFSRWVHEQDYHITLAFLGKSTKEKLAFTNELVAQQLQEQASFSLRMCSLGIFGRDESPRIFWAGLHHEQQLFDLQRKVFTACTNAGFELEKRPFSPHITLARKWAGESRFDKQLLNSFNMFQQTPIEWTAKEVVLYKTNLMMSPKYETITSFSLNE